jgi:DNA-binding response OmpR family regulator
MSAPNLDSNHKLAAPGIIDPGQPDIRFKNATGSGLTRLEGALLRYLTANSGRPVSRAEILASVWRLNPACVVTRTVDMHVAKLRSKLRKEADPSQLVTIRGRGYMLVKNAASAFFNPPCP